MAQSAQSSNSILSIKNTDHKVIAVDRKKLIFIIITVLIAVFDIMVIPADFFSHGFYCDEIAYDNISEADRLGKANLADGAYKTEFMPVKKHFAGFEIYLTNLPDNSDGLLELSTYATDGHLMETIDLELSKIKDSSYYMVYTDKSYKENVKYMLTAEVKDCSAEPQMELVDNDYLSEESMENNLLIGYAYGQSTFTDTEKTILFLLSLMAVCFLFGELWLNNENSRKGTRLAALFLGITALLTWNYMFNSFDEENKDRFADFQNGSESLVISAVEAEKKGVALNEYGLGVLYSIMGSYHPTKPEAINDDTWTYGYSKTEPKILIGNNEYTNETALAGGKILFENGESFDILDVSDGGAGTLCLTLNSSGPLNYYKYGDLANASLCRQNGSLYLAGTLTPYKSQFGLQGKVWRHLARYVKDDNWLDVLNRLCALVTAAVFTCIILLLAKKYNFLLSLCFGFTFLLSPWIVDFARNLYWVEFTWFLPMLVGLICSIRIQDRTVRIICYAAAFLTVAGKALCGYEYITAVMLGLISFLLADGLTALLQHEKKQAFLVFRTVFILGIIALAGFFTALCIHASLRGEGDISEGIKSIIESDVLRRVGGGELNDFAEVYWPSLNASAWDVLRKYFHLPTDIIAGIDANVFPMLCLLPIFIFIYDYIKKQLHSETMVLYIVFFITSISWFVLGKSHSYIHTHMNYVMWYFGFVQICFYVVASKIMEFIGKGNNRYSR